MHEQNIKDLKDEVIRLANCRLNLLEEVENIFTSDEEESIKKDIINYKRIIKNEIEKVNNLELVLAVVGTMKSGKSTVINAIIGYELLPNRELPMTTIPTLITHKEGQTDPYMELNEFKLIKKTQNELKQINLKDIYNKNKINIEELLNFDFSNRIDGVEQINKALSIINDLLRICHDNNKDFSVENFDTIEQIPRIYVQFESLPEQNGNKIGRFSIVDTPGMNEAEHRAKLKQIFKQQIDMASAVLFIMDYTQFGSEATQEVKVDVDRILDISDNIKNKLFVAVNKFDEKNYNTMDEDATKKYVSEKVFDNRVIVDKIFPSSAFYAFLCNIVKKQLSLYNKKPDINEKWIKDFIKKVYGDTELAEEDYLSADIPKLEKRINSFYLKSKFKTILDSAVEILNKDSHYSSIETILIKLITFNSEIKKGVENFYPENILKIKEESLKNTVENLNNIIEHLKKDINLVNNLGEKINNSISDKITNITSHINSESEKLFNQANESIEDVFNKSIEELKKFEEVNKENKENEIGTEGRFFKLISFIFSVKKNKSESIMELFEKGIISTKEEEVAKEIKTWITEIYKSLSDSIKENISNVFIQNIDDIEDDIQNMISKEIDIIIKSIKNVLKERQFNIDFGLLDLPKEISYQITSKVSSDIVKVEKKGGYWEDESGFGGKWGRFWDRNNEWGWGRYYVDEYKEYTFNKKEILESIHSGLNAIKNNIIKENHTIIENEVMPPINDYFTLFKSKIEELRNILISSIKEKQEKEKSVIDNLLNEIKKKIKVIENDKESISLCKNELNRLKTGTN